MTDYTMAVNQLLREKLAVSWEKLLEKGIVTCGLIDGGDLVMAKAYQRLCSIYFNKKYKTSLVSLKSLDGQVQHFAVLVNTPSDSFYFDQDGISRLEPLIEKMKVFERVFIKSIDVTTSEDIAGTSALKNQKIVDLLIYLVKNQMPISDGTSNCVMKDINYEEGQFVITSKQHHFIENTDAEITS